VTLYDVPAPAKINLFLHVVGRRPDGYHLLQSVFRFIGLYDTLNFDLRADGRIVCDSTIEGLDPADDLVVRAATVLQQATGSSYGAQINYTKHIPSGGGLGGGSSDAASTLIALNRLWKTGLSRSELMRLALPLGADVPVFVFGQPAFAEGIGEILSPVDVPEGAYLVVQPHQKVPTAGVFSSPDLTRDSPSFKMSVFTDWQTIEAGHKRDKQDSKLLFGRNDLEPVVFGMYPAVRRAAEWLVRQGVEPRMTGSGACLFVEFVSIEQAVRWQDEIIGKIRCESSGSGKEVIDNVWACLGLIDHPLRHWLQN
jgi:4-diphosphocytidyl-2-C-methyl-D-erythritol kinase